MNSIEQLETIEKTVQQLQQQLQQYEETVQKEREQLQQQNAFEQDLLHLIEGLETNSIDSMLLIDQLRKNRQIRRDLKNGQTMHQRIKEQMLTLQREVEAFDHIDKLDIPTYSLRTEEGFELSRMLQPMAHPETHFVFQEQEVFSEEMADYVQDFYEPAMAQREKTTTATEPTTATLEISVTKQKEERVEEQVEDTQPVAQLVAQPDITDFHMKRDETGWKLYKNGQPVLSRRKLKRMLELIQEQAIVVYVQEAYRKQADQLLQRLS